MLIYETRDGCYTGKSVELSESEGRSPNWVTVAPPELSGGQVARWTGGKWIVLPSLPGAPPPAADAVDTERDRRVAAGFDWNGVRFQTRPEDRENMAGASVAALGAMTAGAQPGDLRWHGGDSDFVWIAEDNSLHPMDAQTMFAFGQAAMAHKQALIFKARAIKDMSPIPADFADDQYWP